MGAKHFSEIKAWQAARVLAREIYRITAAGPLRADRSMRDQLRRAALSVASNIAEGFSRGTRRDFAHFLDISRGSVSEVQSLLIIAHDVGHLSEDSLRDMSKLADQSARLLAAFQAGLRAQAPS